MSEKELEIFELCHKLSELLGDDKAIADLRLLYQRHPEMFNDMQDVSNTIASVVKQPQIISKNPRVKTDKDFMATKQINKYRLGDIGIRNDKGTNVIYHSNKIRIENLKHIQKRPSVETPPLSTRQDLLAGGKCHISGFDGQNRAIYNEIIPQNTLDSLKNSKSINEFSQNLIKALQINRDLKAIDELSKDTSFKFNLNNIDKEKMKIALEDFRLGKTLKLEALIKTNLKSYPQNLKLESKLGLKQ